MSFYLFLTELDQWKSPERISSCFLGSFFGAKNVCGYAPVFVAVLGCLYPFKVMCVGEFVDMAHLDLSGAFKKSILLLLSFFESESAGLSKSIDSEHLSEPSETFSPSKIHLLPETNHWTRIPESYVTEMAQVKPEKPSNKTSQSGGT